MSSPSNPNTQAALGNIPYDPQTPTTEAIPHDPQTPTTEAIPHDPQTPTIEAISQYVNTVCQQIRWKKARPRITEELSAHLEDTRDAYESQGHSQAAATAQAIADAGDATQIGTQLDRVHRPKPQWAMLGAAAALVALGLAVYAFFAGGLSFERLLFTGFGAAGLLAAYFLDFTWLVKYPMTLFTGVAMAAFVRLLMRYRFIYIPFLTPARASTAFDPAMTGITFFSMGDTITLVFPLALATVIFYARGRGYWGVIFSALSFTLLQMFAFGMSVGSAARFTVIGLMLFGVAIFKGSFNVKRIYASLLAFGPTMLLGVLVLTTAALNDFQRQLLWVRFAAVFNPSAQPYTYGFWSMMTRTILRDAAWFGQGSTEGLSMLFGFALSPPMRVQGISALTAVIGLTGWVSFVVIVSALAFFMAQGMMRCLRQKSNLGLVVSTAVMLTFAVQTVEYVLFNLGFQMASPIALPLIVSCNATLIINMTLVGFMLSVFRSGDAVMDKHYSVDARKWVSWEDGRLIIDFKPTSG